MATSTPRLRKTPTGGFWTLVGLGILMLLIAASWRVATGAELEAKGKEWTLKVTEATDSLDGARKQLEEEAQRLKADAVKREAYWTDQLALARAACPRAAETPVVNPPPPIASAAATSQIKLGQAAKSTADARRIANELSRIKIRPF